MTANPLVNRLLLGVLLALWPASSEAAVFTVNSTVDASDENLGDGVCADTAGACTLRAAIEQANALDGEDEVSVPEGTYVLSLSGWLGVGDDLTLRGAGAATTVIDRGGRSGPVLLNGYGFGPRLVIERLTITGGNRYGGFDSGGIVNFGSLVLSESIVSGNCAATSSWDNLVCGGIVSFGAIAVTHSVITSNFSTPVAVLGGGARIDNTTISGNVSRNGLECFSGYGCHCEARTAGVAALGESPIEIQYSTIAGNRVDSAACAAIPRSVVEGSVRLVGTVLSNPGLANCSIDPGASLGHNLDGDGSCGLTDSTDLFHVGPLLGPLQDNGGPTWTQALLPGSPAIDAVPPADCTFDDDGDPATPEVRLRRDQRGAARPQGAGCDIGAVEVTACSDGLDNDGDGLIDYPSDPGCFTALSVRENPQCQDGLNNDNLTGIDFDGGDSLDINPRDGFIDGQFNAATPEVGAVDPQCAGKPWANRERSGCGLGFEAVFLAPLLARLARKRRA